MEWISVEQLPEKDMKVEWLCEDGKTDYGFYYADRKEFASWDLLSEKLITHWKPFLYSPLSQPEKNKD